MDWLERNRPSDFQWIGEAKWRRDCWLLLYEILTQAGDRNKILLRLDKLGQLRLLIGPDAYDLGELPDYLPMWRFRDRLEWER